MSVTTQVKKINQRIMECEDELKLVEFERTVGLRIARVRKMKAMELQEAEVKTEIAQLKQLADEIKKTGGVEDGETIDGS